MRGGRCTRAARWAVFWVAAVALPLLNARLCPNSKGDVVDDVAALELRTAAGNQQTSATVGSMLRSLRSMMWGSWRAEAGDDGARDRGESGAINEKAVVGARKATALAPLLHASFGLDHYPNYLQRWDIAAIEGLEDQLESQLATVRAQKAMVSL